MISIPAEHIISAESLVRHTNLFNLKKNIDIFCKISQDPQFDSLALLLWPQHLSNGLNMTIKTQNAVMGRPTINSLKGEAVSMANIKIYQDKQKPDVTVWFTADQKICGLDESLSPSLDFLYL